MCVRPLLRMNERRGYSNTSTNTNRHSRTHWTWSRLYDTWTLWMRYIVCVHGSSLWAWTSWNIYYVYMNCLPALFMSWCMVIWVLEQYRCSIVCGIGWCYIYHPQTLRNPNVLSHQWQHDFKRAHYWDWVLSWITHSQAVLTCFPLVWYRRSGFTFSKNRLYAVAVCTEVRVIKKITAWVKKRSHENNIKRQWDRRGHRVGSSPPPGLAGALLLPCLFRESRWPSGLRMY